jgi:hypothetical protein
MQLSIPSSTGDLLIGPAEAVYLALVEVVLLAREWIRLGFYCIILRGPIFRPACGYSFASATRQLLPDCLTPRHLRRDLLPQPKLRQQERRTDPHHISAPRVSNSPLPASARTSVRAHSRVRETFRGDAPRGQFSRLSLLLHRPCMLEVEHQPPGMRRQKQSTSPDFKQ